MQHRASGIVSVTLAAVVASSVGAAPNPWNRILHGACCEGNLAAEGLNTYVLLPELLTGNDIRRSADGGRTWQTVYPPLGVSVPFGVEGDLAAFGTDVVYFGTEVTHGVAAHSDDRGSTWTVVQVPVEFAVNDQAWLYLGPLPGVCAVQTEPYVLAGWYRIGSVALFSCDGGLTWPIQTPLVGLNGLGPDHVVCLNTAHPPAPDGDTRIPNPDFAKTKGGRHGGWGTDGKFYWTQASATSLYVCKTESFGATWEGIEHPSEGSGDNVVTSLAFDQKGTLYVLHTDKLYVSFDQGESIEFVHTLPRWGDQAADGAGQAFTVDGGTVHVALAIPGRQIWYLRGEGADTASPVWTEELVGTTGNGVRLDFMQIVLNDRGVPTIGYTTPGTTTSSRDLAPIAADDSACAVREQPVTIPVLANDSDPDGDPIGTVSVTEPPNGSATLGANGAATYTGDSGFEGNDSFTYTISDAILTSTATVTVEVVAAPPEVTSLGFVNRTTLAWDPADGGEPVAVYDVARGLVTGGLPVGSGPEACLVPGIAAPTTTDGSPPPAGNGFWYLARARRSCAAGAYGSASDGTPRLTAVCP